MSSSCVERMLTVFMPVNCRLDAQKLKGGGSLGTKPDNQKIADNNIKSHIINRAFPGENFPINFKLSS